MEGRKGRWKPPSLLFQAGAAGPEGVIARQGMHIRPVVRYPIPEPLDDDDDDILSGYEVS